MNKKNQNQAWVSHRMSTLVFWVKVEVKVLVWPIHPPQSPPGVDFLFILLYVLEPNFAFASKN